MASYVKLNQLKRQKELIQKRNRAQYESLREKLNKGRENERRVQREIENVECSIFVKELKATGFPIEKKALLIGMALEAKSLLDGPDEMAKANAIDNYIRLYQSFVESQNEKQTYSDLADENDTSSTCEEVNV